MKSITAIRNLPGKRALVRVDFNVPLKNGRVLDDFKIQRSLPTIKYLLRHGARVLLVSHLGRPKSADKKLTLRPVARHLQKFLVTKVGFEKGKESVVLLENIRFHAGEESNDKKFAKKLAGLADLFVLDGFAVTHRDSASVSGVAKFLPAYAGLLLEEEIKGLNRALVSPRRPLIAVIGGAKMDTKIPVIKNLLRKADKILLGGGVVNTCLWANGLPVGGSLIDKDFKNIARALARHKKILMPADVIVGKADGRRARAVKIDKKFSVKADEAIFDIGPLTIKLYDRYLRQANTLIWNGAMGKFEQRPYQYGTYAIARIFAARARGRAFGIVGGGETVEVMRKLKLTDDIDLVSTGGGAMLEYLSGKKLPGVKALK